MVEVKLGQDLQLTSTVRLSGLYSLTWEPAVGLTCTDCPDPLLSTSVSGVYKVIATDIPSGCADSATVQVTILDCDQVFIPNAFSPNFDGVNDRLGLFTADCFTRLSSWRIFDRWGALVYEVNDQAMSSEYYGWDGQIKGQPASEGVYGYQIVLELENGVQKQFRGELLLMR
jgi:gliding motility-associated-like protein